MKTFFEKFWHISAIIIWILSGLAVFILEPDVDRFVIKGMVFGAISSVYLFFFIRPRPQFWRIVAWIGCSWLSYLTAYFGGLHVGDIVGASEALLFGIGGLLGVSVLILAFHILFLKLSWRYVVTLALVAVVIPVAITLLLYPTERAEALYVLWQTSVMIILAIRIQASNIQSLKQSHNL